MYSDFRDEDVMIVDLHGYTVEDRKEFLDDTVSQAPENIKEIVVIHGYHNGNSLLNMVRHGFKHKRVAHKFLSLSQGITSLILR